MTKRNSLNAAVRALACTLAVTTTSLLGGSHDGWAMLAPAATAGAAAAGQRAADVSAIEKTLESQAVQERLKALGLSDAEIRSRLGKLSDAEVRQLAGQLEALNPGGDAGFVTGLLVIAVLVLLIVYLVKRV